MPEIETLLLLALPASGKSEIRTFLKTFSAAECAALFHLRPTVQLDDFPYVHLMRQTDAALRQSGAAPVFFRAADKPFVDARDWGTLIELINEDHAQLVLGRGFEGPHAASWLLERFDRARTLVGAKAVSPSLSASQRAAVTDRLEGDARAFLTELNETVGRGLGAQTLLIEFARGGPDGAKMPLPAPLGYAYSLARLSPAILERAHILYVWVTPEESRRKNDARTDPNDPGSILHHGVPMEVMLNDYGCDDIAYLLEQSDKPGTVRVAAHGRTFHIPMARFDNRVDKTSFVRAPKESWCEDDVTCLRDGLAVLRGLLRGQD